MPSLEGRDCPADELSTDSCSWQVVASGFQTRSLNAVTCGNSDSRHRAWHRLGTKARMRRYDRLCHL